MTVPADRTTRRARASATIGHFARNAPFAIAASSLPGLVNYIIVVYLAYGASLHATGEYRTLFSCYSLIGLAAMYETNKVFIRSIVAEDHKAITALFANRLTFSVGAFAVLAAAWAVTRMLGSDFISEWLVVIAAISAVIYPLDSYLSLLQARGQFNLLFVSELVKYGLALAAFIGAMQYGLPVEQAMMVQLGAMALCNLVYFSLVTRSLVDFGLMRRRFWAMLRSNPARQARLYSFANFVPASLEHIDKLLVGWVFGLEFLGVYTLAYSTGRFLYNALKPALYIYYRRFVDAMPGWRLLKYVGVSFTLLGILNTAVFLLALAYIPAMHRFESGAVTTVILFLAYGIGIVRAIYGQAFSLNKDSDARHALWASIQAALLSIVFLTAGLLSPQPIALVLLALQYPVRDAITIALMSHYRGRGQASAKLARGA